MTTGRMQAILNNFNALDPINYVEIAVLAVVVLMFYRMIARTRAVNMARGIIVLAIVFAVAFFLRLQIITYVLECSLYLMGFALVVLFAPELRHALERIGTLGLEAKKNDLTGTDVGEMLNAVADAVGNLSHRRVGALICFEKNTDLQEYVDSGIMLDALCSSGLLINIFEKNTPLHDGAVIIRKKRVVAATCYLPLTEQYLSKKYGTRHRAALGLSEESDALVVAVSEETGNITCARNGKFLQYLTPEDVMALMVEHLYGKENSPRLNGMVSACFEK